MKARCKWEGCDLGNDPEAAFLYLLGFYSRTLIQNESFGLRIIECCFCWVCFRSLKTRRMRDGLLNKSHDQNTQVTHRLS